MLLELLTLALGIFILAYCSEHGIGHAVGFATVTRIPRIVVGVVILSVGTDLPELVVDITAVRKKEHAIALGDIIGSNVVDSTLGIAVGPLVFPIVFDGRLAFINSL